MKRDRQPSFSIEKLIVAIFVLIGLTRTCFLNLSVMWRDSKPRSPLTSTDIAATQSAYTSFYSRRPEEHLEIESLGEYFILDNFFDYQTGGYYDYEVTNKSDIAFWTISYLHKIEGCHSDIATGFMQSNKVTLRPGKSMIFTCNIDRFKTLTFYADDAMLMKVEFILVP